MTGGSFGSLKNTLEEGGRGGECSSDAQELLSATTLFRHTGIWTDDRNLLKNSSDIAPQSMSGVMPVCRPAESGRSWPTTANVEPLLADVGQSWPKLTQVRTKNRQNSWVLPTDAWHNCTDVWRY